LEDSRRMKTGEVQRVCKWEMKERRGKVRNGESLAENRNTYEDELGRENGHPVERNGEIANVQDRGSNLL